MSRAADFHRRLTFTALRSAAADPILALLPVDQQDARTLP